MSEGEQRGENTNLLTFDADGYGYIDHNPENCINEGGIQFDCTYMFSIQNTAGENLVTSIYVEAELFNPGDIDLKRSYANIVKQGQSIHYELNT